MSEHHRKENQIFYANKLSSMQNSLQSKNALSSALQIQQTKLS
jgi:hypothetical protein